MIPQEKIDKACRTNLIAYCQAKGIEVKREGREYKIVNNDSLYIKADEPYKWYRHSTGNGGKAIDFCMKFLGMDFTTAVTDLLNTTPSDVYIPPTQHYKPNTSTDQKRVIAYLVKKRCISYDIVIDMIRNNHLKQDTNGNCVFGIIDFDGNIIGAELHGTGDTRFKGQTNEQDGFGYTLQVGQNVQFLCFFESAIDLLSYYEIKKSTPTFKDVLLISMGGLKSVVVQTYKNKYPEAKVVMCVDNDDKGKEFATKLGCKIYPTEAGTKDWNEVLKARK